MSLDTFVIETIAAICEIERSQITLVTPLDELAMDSLRLTALAAYIQATHGRVVTPDEIIELLEARCVADIVAIVRRMVEEDSLVHS